MRTGGWNRRAAVLRVAGVGAVLAAAAPVFLWWEAGRPWGRFTQQEIVERTGRLCRSLGEPAAIASVRAVRCRARGNGSPCWMLDARLTDGTEVYASWNAVTGLLATVCFVRAALHGRPRQLVRTMRQATVLARGYVRAAMAGCGGFEGAVARGHPTYWTWVLHGTVRSARIPRGTTLNIYLDARTGRLNALMMVGFLDNA